MCHSSAYLSHWASHECSLVKSKEVTVDTEIFGHSWVLFYHSLAGTVTQRPFPADSTQKSSARTMPMVLTSATELSNKNLVSGESSHNSSSARTSTSLSWIRTSLQLSSLSTTLLLTNSESFEIVCSIFSYFFQKQSMKIAESLEGIYILQ